MPGYLSPGLEGGCAHQGSAARPGLPAGTVGGPAVILLRTVDDRRLHLPATATRATGRVSPAHSPRQRHA